MPPERRAARALGDVLQRPRDQDEQDLIVSSPVNAEATVVRLRRIEGQVRGLQRLIDEDTYCIDILTQISAVTRALQSVAVGLLDEHVRHCVRDAAGESSERADAMIEEATRAIERLVRA